MLRRRILAMATPAANGAHPFFVLLIYCYQSSARKKLPDRISIFSICKKIVC